MPKHPLPTGLHRHSNARGVGSPLLRQWKLLGLLSSSSKRATVYELASRAGVSVKTIRRDLVLFKQLGFDIDATENEFGLQFWRIQPRFETLRSKQRQYRSLRDSVAVLIEQAQTIGDQRLVADLEAVRRNVERKGR